MLSNLVLLLCAPVIWGTHYNVTAGASWQSYLTSLVPGDVLTLLPQTPGTPYTYTITFRNAFVLNGAVNNPIIVQGAPGEEITISMDADRNVVELVGDYFVFQNLRLTATAKGISSIGLRITGNSSHGVVRRVKAFNLPENAFTANTGGSYYDNITFTECEAYNTGGTGECFYVGCQGVDRSTISCVFKNGALTHNHCHNTCFPNACTGGSQGSGYQVKGWGSHSNVVRGNKCQDVASVCILLYDDFDLGPNIVEGNWIVGSVNDAGIQVSAGAIIRNNVITGNKGGIIVTVNPTNLQAGKLNRNIVITGNTIVNNQGSGMRIPSLTDSRVANNVIVEDSGNAFVSQSGSQAGVDWKNNAYFGGSLPADVNTGGAILVGMSSTLFMNAASSDFHPKNNSSLLGAGTPVTDDELPYDIECNLRGAAPTIGAFELVKTGFQMPDRMCGTGAPPTLAPNSPAPSSVADFRPCFLLFVLPFLYLL